MDDSLIERVAVRLKRTYDTSTFMPIPDEEKALWLDMAGAALEVMLVELIRERMRDDLTPSPAALNPQSQP